MNTPKIKTYVLTISRTFPKTHRRAGQSTYFAQQITGKLPYEQPGSQQKLHTIRDNYKLWKKRIDEVNAGRAILSVREWTGKPYNSKQEIILEFDHTSGIGVQELKSMDGTFAMIESKIGIAQNYHLATLAKNDGLSLEDFHEWFKGYDKTTPKAIIHFTNNFRY